MAHEYVAWLEDLGSGDVARFRGKNASLCEMIRALKHEGVRVPDGFATTAAGLPGVHRGQRHRAGAARPPRRAQRRRQVAAPGRDGHPAAVPQRRVPAADPRRDPRGLPRALAPGGTDEDLPEASFAGQQETFLNVHGKRDLLDACRRCYASLFTDRAIAYRENNAFDHLQVALSVGVQKMVRADLAGSGVMFSIDTETGFRAWR